MNKRCKGYCGTFCVSGGCPIENKEEIEEYGGEIPKSCLDCYHNLQCNDCVFYQTRLCIDESYAKKLQKGLKIKRGKLDFPLFYIVHTVAVKACSKHDDFGRYFSNVLSRKSRLRTRVPIP